MYRSLRERFVPCSAYRVAAGILRAKSSVLALREASRSRFPSLLARRAVRDDCGTAAVELAIVFPVFLAMLLGILAYGIYFGAVHSAAQLAADAARASVAGLSDTERAAIALQQVSSTAPTYPLLKANKLTTTAGPVAGDPSSFQVAISYDARSLPIWSFAPFLPLPAQTILRTAVVKRGGY
jgi:Flp pilus assembly protein TadG